MQKTFQKYPFTGDACIRGMMSGLATHNKVIEEPLVIRDKDRRPPRGHLAVHCFCVCSDIALLGDLRVNRTVERDFLFILSIYQRIFLTY